MGDVHVISVADAVCGSHAFQHNFQLFFILVIHVTDSTVFRATRLSKTYLKVASHHLCGIEVRVPGYRFRGPGFDSRSYQIF
jgi:hypothetical protein